MAVHLFAVDRMICRRTVLKSFVLSIVVDFVNLIFIVVIFYFSSCWYSDMYIVVFIYLAEWCVMMANGRRRWRGVTWVVYVIACWIFEMTVGWVGWKIPPDNGSVT